MTDRSAIVVGGGLADMVVAHELRLRGWDAILLERTKRPGGKAGSEVRSGNGDKYETKTASRKLLHEAVR